MASGSMKAGLRHITSRRILVTGAGGLIGQELVLYLQHKYGIQNVLATDVALDRPTKWERYTLAEQLDVTDAGSVEKLVGSFKPNRVYHLAAMLSAKSEEAPLRALHTNITGAHNLLESSRNHSFALYCASTIAAFGPSSPPIVSSVEIMRPNTVYGITKIHMELLGEYYHRKYRTDFRSSRIPIVNSCNDVKGGTATFTVSMFYDLFRTNTAIIPVSLDQSLPIIYLPDLIRSLDDIMEAPVQRFTTRVYTLQSCAVTVGEYVAEVGKRFPGGDIIVKPDFRDDIMRTWPRGTDGRLAGRDWGMKLQFGVGEMVGDMYTRIKGSLGL